MNKTLTRILSGLGANMFGQGVTIGIQLLSLPLFLHFWSISRYGEWLLISAIPSYISMADLGLVAVGMNRMTMLAAAEDFEGAERVFHTMLGITISVISVVALGGVPLIVLWSLVYSGMAAEQTLALVLLLVASLASIYTGVFDAVFRSSGDYSQGVYALNAVRIAEWVGSISGLVIGGTLVSVSCGLLAGRLLGNTATWIYLAWRYPRYTWNLKKATRQEFRILLMPGLKFMALPAGNALSIQGMVILVGMMFGPVVLTVFSTYRTLSRTTVQVINMLSRVLWPEFSRQYGRSDFGKVRELYGWGTVAAVCTSLCGAWLLAMFGEIVLGWWTHGKVAYDPGLFRLFVMVTACTGFWQVGMILLTAVNELGTLSLIYLVFSALSVGVAFVAGKMLGVEGVVLVLLIFEIAMAVFCYRFVKSFFAREDRPAPSVPANG